MKTLILLATLILSASVSFAGPTISGGVPPHPALLTMSIEKPRAGVDFPTDSPPRGNAVLALYNNTRILIYGDVPRLVSAEAGVEYPTDSVPPTWTMYQKVLSFKNGVRIPVNVGFPNNTLIWQLPRGKTVEAATILDIRVYRKSVIISFEDGTRMSL